MKAQRGRILPHANGVVRTDAMKAPNTPDTHMREPRAVMSCSPDEWHVFLARRDAHPLISSSLAVSSWPSRLLPRSSCTVRRIMQYVAREITHVLHRFQILHLLPLMIMHGSSSVRNDRSCTEVHTDSIGWRFKLRTCDHMLLLFQRTAELYSTEHWT
jgi:hypothetical protein